MSNTMEIFNKIKSNEELYGDFELIPLPLEPVQQRIDFFNGKMKELIKIEYMNRDMDAFNKYTKARDFWKETRVCSMTRRFLYSLQQCHWMIQLFN